MADEKAKPTLRVEDTMEAEARTQIMYRQIEAFEEKVKLSSETFSDETFHKMMTELNNSSLAKKLGGVYSLANIRSVVQELEKNASALNEGRASNSSNSGSSSGKSTPSKRENKILLYLKWFLDYVTYMRELKQNFTERIFTPLQEYFYDDSRGDTKSPGVESLLSTPSVTPSSAMMRSVIKEEDEKDLENTDPAATANLEELDAPLPPLPGSEPVSGAASPALPDPRVASYQALMMLGKEFKEVATLYDNTELKNVAERLRYLTERWEVLLDDECEINPDLFSVDSYGSTESYIDEKATNPKLINLVRFVPDITHKCNKAAWLARKWLEIENTKTRDLNEKLVTIRRIQMAVSDKLADLEKSIGGQESILLHQIDELQSLLQREERSSELNIQIYQTEQSIDTLKSQLEKAQNEREQLVKQLTEAKQTKAEDYKTIRLQYEQNRLQRFLLRRNMKVEKYRKSVLRSDMHVELAVRPSMIRFTDHVQETCEELEQKIDKSKKEKRKLEHAMIPLQEDQHKVQEKLWRQQESRRPSVSDPATSNNNLREHLKETSRRPASSASNMSARTQDASVQTVISRQERVTSADEAMLDVHNMQFSPSMLQKIKEVKL
ncbi:uncharacterized protein LOC106165580 [Lingula anatina]|uniref:Uncharacterized protein LOC106165580 n=1 Tax=Lingula anatina TaxID=7574 RepID=A0A1S3IM24_LINAN|nr:uncharacterized protein LOC106165580 [Lingula anatina]|eukprot:XP_013399290.1 uncharacterized protein LOC106165580 [Lingula anatina]